MPTPVDGRFSSVLVGLMLGRPGLSQASLARAANISKTYLSEIINGKKQPTLQVASALDRALAAGGALTDLVMFGLTDDERGAVAAVVDDPRRAGPATVASLQRGLTAYREQDDLLGSAAMLGPVGAQLELVCRLAREVVGVHRPAVVFLAGQYAQFAGWLNTSVGRWDEARLWFARALEWATEIDDPDLAATALSYQAHVAWLTLQPGPVVGQSMAALRNPQVHPCQRGYDYYQAARGLARVGERRAALEMLDLGERTAAEAVERVGDRPVWQYYRDPWMWTLEHGLAQYYIGRTDERVDKPLVCAGLANLRAGLADLPLDMSGADWAGEYMTHAASAAMLVGELDEASHLLDRAGAIAEATHSPRLRRLVHDRERRLGHLRPHPLADAA